MAPKSSAPIAILLYPSLCIVMLLIEKTKISFDAKPQANWLYKKFNVKPHKGRGYQQGIKPIEETAMPRHDGTAVFYIRHAFQFAFQEVTKRAENSTDGCDDKVVVFLLKRFKETLRQHREYKANGHYAKYCATDGSFPGFLWRNFGERCFADERPNEVGHGVVNPKTENN